MNEKETDEIINSLEGLKPAEPGPFLYAGILERIRSAEEEYTPLRIVWLAAASFLLLLLLNIQALRRPGNGRQTSAKEIAAGYHLLNTNMINYNENE